MKIAILSPFYPYRGGISQFGASLYRAFEHTGHQVQAYTFTRQYPELLFPGSSQYVTDKDSADQVPALRVLDSMNPLSYWTAARKIGEFQPDILILKYWMPFFAPSLGTVARQLRKKGCYVLTVLDNITPHEQRIGDQQLNRYFLNSNDGFVAMSSAVEKDLKALRPDAPYFFHPHPLYSHFGDCMDTDEARAKLGIPAHKKVLLFFGLIREYKGLDILIDAFNQLNDGYYLLIAGEPYGDYSPLRNAIAAGDKESLVGQHIRYIPDEEVPLFFSAADVCVLPYRSATQSGVTAISYHFNVPVIATDVGGLREIIEPYRAGLVVPEPSPTLFASYIERFFEKDLTFYQENIAQFKEEYSWEGLANKILAFMKEQHPQ